MYLFSCKILKSVNSLTLYFVIERTDIDKIHAKKLRGMRPETKAAILFVNPARTYERLCKTDDTQHFATARAVIPFLCENFLYFSLTTLQLSSKAVRMY